MRSGRESAPVARGVFARFDGQQRWAAGTPQSLRSREPAWLERWFPVPSKVPPRAGVVGALWVRWVDGSWFVCHACVPAWSIDRSIPAWIVSQLDAHAFGRIPVLASESEAVEAASRSEAGARSWATERLEVPSAPWDPSAIAPLARLFDVVSEGRTEANERVHRLPAGMLGPGGWIALQAVLAAMREAGVPAPCALSLGDPGWLAGARAALPSDSYVFLPGMPPAAAAPELRARGVEVSRFIDGLEAAGRAVVAAAHAAGPGRRFVDAVAGAVPLELVDPAGIEPRECRTWAAKVAGSENGPDAIARRLDGLLSRSRGGEETLVGPILSLAAHWAQASGAKPDARSRLDGWVAPLLNRR
jgi:hypothetical protein